MPWHLAIKERNELPCPSRCLPERLFCLLSLAQEKEEAAVPREAAGPPARALAGAGSNPDEEREKATKTRFLRQERV